MPVPRRKARFSTLPRPAAYLLGTVIALAVVGLVWVSGVGRPAPGWYTTGVKVAAVILLVALALRLVVRRRGRSSR